MPNTEDILASDVSYYFSAREYRTEIILTCCLFEVLRDNLLERKHLSRRSLNTSETDLLKHLSVGFEAAFSRNLRGERSDLFEFLRSCWIARGHVAHGQPLMWREAGKAVDFEKYPTDQFTQKVEGIASWIRSVG